VLAEQDEQHLPDAVALIYHILQLNTSTRQRPRKVNPAYGPSDKTEGPCGHTGGAVIAAAIYSVTPELRVLTDTASARNSKFLLLSDIFVIYFV
jgi:hypothetical protein